jgi:hypothetical protein
MSNLLIKTNFKKPAQIHFHSNTLQTITNMDSTIAGSENDNINIDSTITGSESDNINIESTITGSVNDKINMDSTITGSYLCTGLILENIGQCEII